MYFTELIVKAFGLHLKQVINFTPGLNVIVGESERGKTTLIRALYLLIENSPRGGEKLYQSWLTDNPLSIQLKDDKGNIIKRKKNKYYLNDSKPLKAFGTSVPEPIRQLLNFKEINWQKQHDIHYLLFNTGGSAAKLLNSATGMSDQEVIIDDFKKQLSHSKSEIKRHKKNNEEHLKTTKRLKDIVRYKLKALAIVNLEEEMIELKNKTDKLENILSQLESIREIKMKYRESKEHHKEINSIIHDLEETKHFGKSIQELKSVLNKIEETKIIDPKMIVSLLKTLHALHSKNLEFETLTSKTNLLKNYIKQIEEAKETQERYQKNIEEHQKQIDELFINLGYCPLCRRRVKDGDTCCR
jgi:DNA repair ATPase RecN